MSGVSHSIKYVLKAALPWIRISRCPRWSYRKCEANYVLQPCLFTPSPSDLGRWRNDWSCCHLHSISIPETGSKVCSNVWSVARDKHNTGSPQVMCSCLKVWQGVYSHFYPIPGCCPFALVSGSDLFYFPQSLQSPNLWEGLVIKVPGMFRCKDVRLLQKFFSVQLNDIARLRNTEEMWN